MNEQILTLADTARNSLSSYCINECKSKCCRHGSLLLQSEQELHVIIENKKNQLLKKNILKVTEQGNYTLNFDKGGSCKHLSGENMCQIHKNPKRPKICGDFPLFVFKGYYSLATDFCPAAKEGLLDKYCRELEVLGQRKI
jgi:Fe-S-cluster containining protein